MDDKLIWLAVLLILEVLDSIAEFRAGGVLWSTASLKHPILARASLRAISALLRHDHCIRSSRAVLPPLFPGADACRTCEEAHTLSVAVAHKYSAELAMIQTHGKTARTMADDLAMPPA